MGGPTWTSDGNYPIVVTYNGKMEKSIDYEKSITAAPEAAPEAAPDFATLKLKIPNFPSFDKSPQHYIDRYNSESDYKH